MGNKAFKTSIVLCINITFLFSFLLPAKSSGYKGNRCADNVRYCTRIAFYYFISESLYPSLPREVVGLNLVNR